MSLAGEAPCFSKVAVPWVLGVNPADRSFRNELDSDLFRHDVAFVSEYVHVTTSGIDESHAPRVHVRLAIWVVRVITCHCTVGDNDQAMSGVRVPAGATTRLPDITLHV